MTDSDASTAAPSVTPDRWRIVHVDRVSVTLNSGEVLLARSEKLRHLCEQLAQDSAEVTVRTWWTQDKGQMVAELIEVHRVTTAPPTSGSEEVF